MSAFVRSVERFSYDESIDAWRPVPSRWERIRDLFGSPDCPRDSFGNYDPSDELLERIDDEH